LEPLTFGALCNLSTACGCAYFIEKRGGLELNNIVLADYITLPYGWEYPNAYAMRNIGSYEREQIEAAESYRAAVKIMERLPRQGHDAWVLLEDGRALAEKMSWKVVAEEQLLPALEMLF
jgi:hypothetical protein